MWFVSATPGPPYALAVVAVSKRYVDLQWEAPKNDGGRPILRWTFFEIYISLREVQYRYRLMSVSEIRN